MGFCSPVPVETDRVDTEALLVGPLDKLGAPASSWVDAGGTHQDRIGSCGGRDLGSEKLPSLKGVVDAQVRLQGAVGFVEAEDNSGVWVEHPVGDILN